MKNNVFAFKVSNNLKNDIIDFYKDEMLPNKPPYSIFQVKKIDCTITFYESGKIVFQGIGADIEASYWTEQERIKNNRNILKEINDKKLKKEKNNAKELSAIYFKGLNTIGSDEVGTGDYFGPIIITASYVDTKQIGYLNELGVRDSKKITDDKIIKIAPDLIKNIKHVTYIFTPDEYNKYGINNMNKVKAILHNKALYKLKNEKLPYQKIVVDQFCPPASYYNHIKEVPNKVFNITFTPHAEDKCLSVAVSSIISRYIFLKEMKKLNNQLGEFVPLGAGENVDQFGKNIVLKYGINKLNEIAKLNFNNTKKIKDLLESN